MTTAERFIVARGRLSYKRHGRHGESYFVIDTAYQVSVAHGTREQCAAEAVRRNAAAWAAGLPSMTAPNPDREEQVSE